MEEKDVRRGYPFFMVTGHDLTKQLRMRMNLFRNGILSESSPVQKGNILAGLTPKLARSFLQRKKGDGRKRIRMLPRQKGMIINKCIRPALQP